MFAEVQIAYHVLMLIGSAGPVAIYFLLLGLVNCQSRPCLVSSRSDFIALSVVLAPLLLWSLPVAVQFGSGWMLGLAALLLAYLFRRLVPGRHEGFVIYNISRSRGLALLESVLEDDTASFRRIGDSEWMSHDGHTRITATTFSLLRSVTIQINGDASGSPAVFEHCQAGIERRIARIEQLPSVIGACLVFAGVGIAVVPMWLVTRHIQDLVDVVVSFFG